MKFHKDGTSPKNPSDIFVFGSNLSGMHMGGAARAAELHFGAKDGKGVGLHGLSYAIPTKGLHARNTLTLKVINNYVKKFISFTNSNPDKTFFVTRIGCVIAGYSDADIAPMFRGAVNCSFAKEWKPYLV
jgi:hypothetical protein